MHQPIKRPERLTLVLCKWGELHKERGDHLLVINGSKYFAEALEFEEWILPYPTPLFVMEFYEYFKDCRFVKEYMVCHECQKEIEHHINTEIIEAGGQP